MERIQRNLHLFGRYGITMFAISGARHRVVGPCGKVKGEPLHRLLGERKRTRIPAYASLLRIGDPALVAKECETALQRGYRAIKLHETTVPAVLAARQAIGAGIPADGRHELPDGRAPKRSRSPKPAARRRRCFSRSRSGRRRISRPWPRCARRAGSTSRPARMPARCISSAR